jgi:uncharacterized protein YbaP (TraB family)
MHLLAALLAGLVGWAVTSGGQTTVAPPPLPAPQVREAPRPATPPAGALPLWRVADGQRTIAWLLASIHALPKGRYPLPAAIDEAFAASGTLVEEVDLAEMESPATMQVAATRALLLDGTTLEAIVGRETWAAVRDKAEASGLPAMAVQRMKPWMAALALVAPVLQKAGYDPAFGVDRHFYARARERNLPIQGLETPAYQFDRLDGLERTVQVELLKTTLEDLDEQVAQVDEVTAAWAGGDVAGLERLLLGTFRESPPVYARLIVERNRAWVAPVADCTAKPAPCFVVVGAAHLVGPDGLVALLRARGLTVDQQ